MFKYILIILLASSSAFSAVKIFNPNRNWHISLLIAAPGKNIESLRGHAAIRLSLNGIPTNQDPVITFYGKTPDGLPLIPTALRALGFAQHLPSFVEQDKFDSFVKTYANENRETKSYRIKLKPNERQKILTFLNKEVTTTQGSRPFQIFIYNCAVMSIEALNAGLTHPIPRLPGINMPNKLPKILIALGIADPKPI